MTLDITADADGMLGDFSDKELRTLVFETAQALYRPAHDVLVGAHADDLRKWGERNPHGRAKDSSPSPVFDDAMLAPVWAACLARARAHVGDMLSMDLSVSGFGLPSLQAKGASGASREKSN